MHLGFDSVISKSIVIQKVGKLGLLVFSFHLIIFTNLWAQQPREQSFNHTLHLAVDDSTKVEAPFIVTVKLNEDECEAYRKIIVDMDRNKTYPLNSAFFNNICLDEDIYNPYIELFQKTVEKAPEYEQLARERLYGELKKFMEKIYKLCQSEHLLQAQQDYKQ